MRDGPPRWWCQPASKQGSVDVPIPLFVGQSAIGLGPGWVSYLSCDEEQALGSRSSRIAPRFSRWVFSTSPRRRALRNTRRTAAADGEPTRRSARRHPRSVDDGLDGGSGLLDAIPRSDALAQSLRPFLTKRQPPARAFAQEAGSGHGEAVPKSCAPDSGSIVIVPVFRSVALGRPGAVAGGGGNRIPRPSPSQT